MPAAPIPIPPCLTTLLFLCSIAPFNTWRICVIYEFYANWSFTLSVTSLFSCSFDISRSSILSFRFHPRYNPSLLLVSCLLSMFLRFSNRLHTILSKLSFLSNTVWFLSHFISSISRQPEKSRPWATGDLTLSALFVHYSE